MKCPHCNQDHPEGTKFCPETGLKMVLCCSNNECENYGEYVIPLNYKFCPECHGTLKCKKCNGQGVVYPHGRMWEYKTCDVCGGTGTCHTCDIPRRPGRFGGPPTEIGNGFK